MITTRKVNFKFVDPVGAPYAGRPIEITAPETFAGDGSLIFGMRRFVLDRDGELSKDIKCFDDGETAVQIDVTVYFTDTVSRTYSVPLVSGSEINFDDLENISNLQPDQEAVVLAAFDSRIAEAVPPLVESYLINNPPPAGAVDSVNGQTGTVVLTSSNITEGSNLYHTSARVLAVVLTGISFLTNSAILATDTIVIAFGKLQAQITALLSSLTSHTGNTSNPHGVTKAQVGLPDVPNVDTTNPANITQDSTHRFHTDLQAAAWTAKDTDAIAALRNGVNTAGDDLNKLYSLITAINAIIGGATADGDSIVNTVAELLAVFSTYPEGVDLVTTLGGKVNTSDVVNALTTVASGKVLDARQGKTLKDLIDALSAANTGDETTATIKSKLGITTLSGSNTGDETTTTIGSLINSSTDKATPINADYFSIWDSVTGLLKKVSGANIKAFLKTYFDTLYQAILVSGTNIKTINSNSLLGGGDLVISGGSSIDESHPIKDTNNNELLEFDKVGSAVNNLKAGNAATGNSPTLSATGGDPNINLGLTAKGSGAIQCNSQLQVPGGDYSQPYAVRAASSASLGIDFHASGLIGFFSTGVRIGNLTTDGFNLPSGSGFYFNSSTGNNAGNDCGISRAAAGIVKINDGGSGLGKLVIGGATPSSASDTGIQGQITWDSSYIYICVATNTWKRVAIASW